MQQNRKRTFNNTSNGNFNKGTRKSFDGPAQQNGDSSDNSFMRPLIRIMGEKWFEHDYNEVSETKLNHADQVYLEQMQRAKKFLNRDIDLHEKVTKVNKKSEEAWLASVVEKGTMSDKLSAVQLKFQQAPVHSLNYLEKLIVLFEKKKMRDSVNLFKCLKEIMVKDLLPPNRKLISFDMRPLGELSNLSSGNTNTEHKRLILWKFEDELKKLYQRIVVAGQELASSQIEGVAEQACIIVADLLILRPEQEQFLLNALVNKIGHPSKKVDVTVTHQLERLLEKHPNMRLTVVVELERLIFRKNIIERTQFYAIHSLNRVVLRSGDDDLALKLLRIYFSLFRILIVKEATLSRLLEMIVRGANQAFPYAKDRADQLNVEMNDMYMLVHKAPKMSTSLSILSLLYQMQSHNSDLTDRFYSALYQRMQKVKSSSADGQFFNLIKQALKSDTIEERVRAFIKRLLQLALNNTPSFAAAALLTYDELLKEKPNLIKLGDEKTQATFMTTLEGNGYKPEVRNPLFARADMTTDTELLLLSRHYHPSVSHFAKSIIRGKPIVYHGDPIMDFTLIRFLDRFAFKNPKIYKPTPKKEGDDDEDEVKPKKAKRGYQPRGVKRMAPGSTEYANVKDRDVPKDEQFIHRFASIKMKQQKALEEIKKEQGGDATYEFDNDDIASVDSDDFDRIVEKFEPGEANDDFELDAVNFTK